MDLDDDELRKTQSDFYELSMSDSLDQDSYGEVIGTENTYKGIAKMLTHRNSVVIGFTDQKGTHYDILFTYHPVRQCNNYLQRGLVWTDLFVSVLGFGSFGFNFESYNINPGYIAEKLCMENHNIDSLAALINGVIKYIVKGDNCLNE